MHFQQIKVGLLACAFASCSSEDPSPHGGVFGESEAEAEVPPDQQCPEEGCETDTVCQKNANCPAEELCRMYECDRASAMCRYWDLDQDGDGFVPEDCGGQDCDDEPPDTKGMDGCEILDPDNPLCGGFFINPNQPERCNGEDDNCNNMVDEGCPTMPEQCAADCPFDPNDF